MLLQQTGNPYDVKFHVDMPNNRTLKADIWGHDDKQSPIVLKSYKETVWDRICGPLHFVTKMFNKANELRNNHDKFCNYDSLRITPNFKL